MIGWSLNNMDLKTITIMTSVSILYYLFPLGVVRTSLDYMIHLGTCMIPFVVGLFLMRKKNIMCYSGGRIG